MSMFTEALDQLVGRKRKMKAKIKQNVEIDIVFEVMGAIVLCFINRRDRYLLVIVKWIEENLC